MPILMENISDMKDNFYDEDLANKKAWDQGAENDHESQDSDESISSADERDLELQMSGDNNSFFEAYELIRKFQQYKSKYEEEKK